jgi:lysophospholipase L1-like esterase
MKTILCFGDSNTWGFLPASISAPFPVRHPIEIRWTGVLARLLGPDFRVIEEGQNGRTTVHEDPFNVARKGLDYLPACLESHKPIDLVVMMLGSNDLKSVFNVPPGEVAAGAGVLARLILNHPSGPRNQPPKLLLICPPPVGDLSHLPDLDARIGGGPARSRQLPRHFETLAANLGCAYLNSQDIVSPSPEDGIHLDPPEHRKLAEAIALKVQSLLN